LNLATTKPSEHWRRSWGFLRQRCIGICRNNYYISRGGFGATKIVAQMTGEDRKLEKSSYDDFSNFSFR